MFQIIEREAWMSGFYGGNLPLSTIKPAMASQSQKSKQHAASLYFQSEDVLFKI